MAAPQGARTNHKRVAPEKKSDATSVLLAAPFFPLRLFFLFLSVAIADISLSVPVSLWARVRKKGTICRRGKSDVDGRVGGDAVRERPVARTKKRKQQKDRVRQLGVLSLSPFLLSCPLWLSRSAGTARREKKEEAGQMCSLSDILLSSLVGDGVGGGDDDAL